MRSRVWWTAAALMSAAAWTATAAWAQAPAGTTVGRAREVGTVERFADHLPAEWALTHGSNVSASLTLARSAAGEPVLEARAARKDPRDTEPGHNWMGLARKGLRVGALPADLDGLRFVLGSRREAQWWVSVTLTTDAGESFSSLVVDHTFPAGRLVPFDLPLAQFLSNGKEALTPEKARRIDSISFSTSSPGTSLLLSRVSAYRHDRRAWWLDFTTSHPANNLFQRGEPVTISLAPGGAIPAQAAMLRYRVRDFDGRLVSSGSTHLTGSPRYSFRATPPTFGYYEVTATLADAAGRDLLPTSCIRGEGTVPDGLGTFSVLPHTLAENAARSRRLGESAFFGLHGDFLGLADYLGVTWRLEYSQWRYLEPEKPDRSAGPAPWARALLEGPPAPDYHAHILPFCLNMASGTPDWAKSPTPARAPAFASWEAALAMVGDAVKAEKHRYGHMRHRLYGAMWEVDLNSPPFMAQTPEQTPSDIVDAYRRVSEVVRTEDPTGHVIGPCSSVLRPDWFANVFEAGILRYVDGIETHGYADGVLTPEMNDYPGKLAQIRALMVRYGAGRSLPIYITEAGQPGILGSTLEARSQAARIVRLCTILKGEGVRAFLPFYGVDYERSDYFGFMYNLEMEGPGRPWATKRVCPKPTVNALAACVDMLEGATPGGRLRAPGPGVWAYAFRRGKQTITAVWCPAGKRRVTLLTPAARSVQLVDLMGHASRVRPSRGTVSLMVGEAPVYLVCAR